MNDRKRLAQPERRPWKRWDDMTEDERRAWEVEYQHPCPAGIALVQLMDVLDRELK